MFVKSKSFEANFNEGSECQNLGRVGFGRLNYCDFEEKVKMKKCRKYE